VLESAPASRCLAIVDAKDEAAKGFYQHLGFAALLDNDLVLYLPLGR
jgi:hypothetical protein